jgi:hypothetical protein
MQLDFSCKRQLQNPNFLVVILPLLEISPLESLSSSECEERRRFEARINVAFQFVDDIQKLVQLLLEWLKRSIFSKRLKVVIGLGVTTKKPMEILDLCDEKDDESIGVHTTTNYKNTSSLDNYKNYIKGDVTIGGKTTI